MGVRANAAVVAVVGITVLSLSVRDAAPAPERSARPRSLYDLEVAVLGKAHADANLEATREAEASVSRPALPRAAATVGTPDQIGQWSSVIMPSGKQIPAVHAVLMKTGKVLVWTGNSVIDPVGGYSEVATTAGVLDPVTRSVKQVDPPHDMNVFCGGATVLGDGTVLVVGGAFPEDGWSSEGIPVALTFDPTTETWTRLPDMHAGRWYPSLAELKDGSALIVGGRDITERPNNDVETIGPAPNMTPIVRGQLPLNWYEGLYPKEYLLPDGRVISYAGSRTDFFDPASWMITAGPKSNETRYSYPSSVLMPLGGTNAPRVFVTGGDQTWDTGTKATSEILDLSTPTPAFVYKASMPQPRTNMNLVILPDGRLLGVGGNGSGKVDLPQYAALLYNSIADTWTTMASQSRRRAYHSTALLLPSGQVLSTGDNNVGGGQATMELYSPPYLFKGTRPTITTASTTVSPGATVDIATSTDVAKAVLVAPGAVTHATDMHQRLIELPLTTVSPGVFTAVGPSSNVAPPGPYMLFALNAAGVPSVARWINVVNKPPTEVVPIASDAFTRSVAAGWGSADEGGAYIYPTYQQPSFSVNGTTGQFTLPTALSSRWASLASVPAANVDGTVTFAISKVPVGGTFGDYASMVLRRVALNTEYRLRLRLRPDGAVLVSASKAVGNTTEVNIGAEVLVAGLHYTAGAPLRMRSQVVGTSPTTIRIKVWPGGSAEPSQWTVVQNDAEPVLQTAGGFGLGGYLSSAVTNGPVVISVDDFSVKPVTP